MDYDLETRRDLQGVLHSTLVLLPDADVSELEEMDNEDYEGDSKMLSVMLME